MPSLMTRAALLSFAFVPALAFAQDTTRVASDPAAGQTAGDTAAAKADNRPTIPGSIFVGSLVWYPGALGGALLAGGAVFCDNCSSSRTQRTEYGALAGAGLVTGLTVAAIARASPRCSRSELLRAAVLGAELGSFATAGATGLLNNRPIHQVSPYAALALPVVSATFATLLTRRCHQG